MTIIIPCYWYNERLIELTKKCLESLETTTKGEKLYTIVVDDGSPISYRPKCDRLIVRNENGGYTKAVNTGLEETNDDIIIVGNNDLEFYDQHWLRGLVQPLEDGNDISCIMVSDSDGFTIEKRYEYDAKFGSLFAMKREVYDKLGNFDEQFKGYFTDLDYRRRALNAGFKIVKNYGAFVHHIGKATYALIDEKDSQYQEAEELYKAKWGFLE